MLSQLYGEHMQWAVDEATLRGAQLSVTEAAMMRTVTNLAFIFLPMSLVAAVFGMNVKELQVEPYPGLWTFFSVAIPTTMGCMIVLRNWNYVMKRLESLMEWRVLAQYTMGDILYRYRPSAR